MVKIPEGVTPAGAVAGLSDLLLALGDELRKANHQVGEFRYDAGEDAGGEKVDPVLFFDGAEVELAVAFSASASGGVNVWVINAKTEGEYERSGKVTVRLNAGDGPQLPVGK